MDRYADGKIAARLLSDQRHPVLVNLRRLRARSVIELNGNPMTKDAADSSPGLDRPLDEQVQLRATPGLELATLFTQAIDECLDVFRVVDAVHIRLDDGHLPILRLEKLLDGLFDRVVSRYEREGEGYGDGAFYPFVELT